MVLIHIGYSKCASTTLQEIFENNASIEYVHKPEIFREKNKEKTLIEDWLLDACQRKSDKSIVVSHEHMLLSKIDPIFGISIGGKKEAENLVHLIDENCNDYCLLLIVREQSKMIASRYLQYIMQGGKSRLLEFVKELLPAENPFKYVDYRFNAILNTLSNGNVKEIICYDVRQIGSNEFMNHLGDILNTKIDRVSGERNVAVSKVGAAIIRIINVLLVEKKETYVKKTETRGPYIFWLLLVVLVRKTDNFYSGKFGRKDVMTSVIKDRIEKIYFDDNNKLKKEYGIDLFK